MSIHKNLLHTIYLLLLLATLLGCEAEPTSPQSEDPAANEETATAHQALTYGQPGSPEDVKSRAAKTQPGLDTPGDAAQAPADGDLCGAWLAASDADRATFPKDIREFCTGQIILRQEAARRGEPTPFSGDRSGARVAHGEPTPFCGGTTGQVSHGEPTPFSGGGPLPKR